MNNGVSVESIKVVSEDDDTINLEGRIVMHKVTPVGKKVSVDYTIDLWETHDNVVAKMSHSLTPEKDLYLFELSIYKNPDAPLYLEFAVKCDIAGSVFWTNGYQYIYDEDSQKEFFFNEFEPQNPTDNMKECIVCNEDVNPDDIVKVTDQCDHEDYMCRKCVKKNVKDNILDNELSNKGNFDILCPDVECRAVLQEQDVKKFVNEKLFNRYEKLKLNVALSLMPNFYWCANEECGSGQFHDEGDAAPIMTCTECKRKSCVVHKLLIDTNRFSCPECESERNEPVSPSNTQNEAEGTVVKTKKTYFSKFKSFIYDKKNDEPSQALKEIEIEEENTRLKLKKLDELKKAEMRKQQEEKRRSLILLKQEKKTEAYMQQLKQCPACKSRIQKSGGSDRMNCGNPTCRHEFCWM
ncbi:13582_t:CDS:2 [Dentiscutata erythropus]|uniref:RBR-type E3 ubiquitin transferase n=1 Tax=Dentiscutata erythropus TaxID=1348616 RepID=A0A9N9HNX2_9GLOM|nr:13582_t:CDS:2 [Dentiscutata erythropus]